MKVGETLSQISAGLKSCFISAPVRFLGRIYSFITAGCQKIKSIASDRFSQLSGFFQTIRTSLMSRVSKKEASSQNDNNMATLTSGILGANRQLGDNQEPLDHSESPLVHLKEGSASSVGRDLSIVGNSDNDSVDGSHDNGESVAKHEEGDRNQLLRQDSERINHKAPTSGDLLDPSLMTLAFG